MASLRNLIENFIEIDEQYFSLFYSKFEKITANRKTILTSQGEVEDYIYFIEKGILRYFMIEGDVDEKDLTFNFAFEGSFASAYDSFISRMPSRYNLQCITASVLWRIKHADLVKIYEATPKGQMIGRLIAEQLFMEKAYREQSLLRESPQQRYESLFNNKHMIINKINLKYIASYIGITPQGLSKIRRRIS